MAREKYKTLTEQMFYLLLCLSQERCGVEIMDRVNQMTKGRVIISSGTLYGLIGDFLIQGMIEEKTIDGKKKNYRITTKGKHLLLKEYERLKTVIADVEQEIFPKVKVH